MKLTGFANTDRDRSWPFTKQPIIMCLYSLSAGFVRPSSLLKPDNYHNTSTDKKAISIKKFTNTNKKLLF